MKIHLDGRPADHYHIDAYEPGRITVNGTHYSSSVIISARTVLPDWPPVLFSDLATQHIDQIITLKPEIIIIGTGKHLLFPAPELISRVFEQGIGFEVMDTGAACRCYNLLMSEGRNVAAGLIIIEA